jgi:EF-P beta-lysylation protein EpmB
MLQHKLVQTSSKPWQQALADAVREPLELLQILGLPADLLAGSEMATAQFPLRVPRGYIARMAKGDADDPLLKQVLPLGLENELHPAFSLDPVADHDAILRRGLLQKYQGRVLVMTTAACAVHCRYCFRRHFPYAEQGGKQSHWQQVVTAIDADPGITEVILSGGDPLSLNDEQLGGLVDMLAQIPHLKRLRIHSRYPVVLPERIDNELISRLAGTRLQCVMVIHCNHANEINSEVHDAMQSLASADITLLNQSVLLHGVNDDAQTLCDLSETLFESGVLPYYLHLLDKVQGASHFFVEKGMAQRLMKGVRSRMPGYLVPQLVEEVAGAPYKIPL